MTGLTAVIEQHVPHTERFNLVRPFVEMVLAILLGELVGFFALALTRISR
jgi:hypothetical protein